MEAIIAELENLCRKWGRTSDPVKLAEINTEIERLSWMIEEGVTE